MSFADRWLLLAHAAATLYMVGLIWFVQVVHYPLFARVGRVGFSDYSQHHQSRTTWVVAGPMVLEAGTAVLLACRGGTMTWVGLALVLVIWLSTALWQVPRHQDLSGGFVEEAHRRLVASNWVRTAAWTARGWIVLFLLDQGLGGASG